MSGTSSTSVPPSGPGARSRHRGLALSGLAFAVLIILLGVAVLASLSLSRQVRTSDQTHRYGKIAHLWVDVDSGDITIDATSDGTVSVARQLRWSPRTTGHAPAVTERLDGDSLTVTGRGCGASFGFAICDTRLVIAVPAGTALVLDGDSAASTVRGLTGAVRLHTDSGRVDLSGLAGEVRVSVDSGSVTGTGLKSSKVSVNTDSGSIQLEFAGTPTEVSTHADSGSTAVLVPAGSGPYAVKTHTDSGSRHVGVHADSAAGRHITATADSGSVTVDYR